MFPVGRQCVIRRRWLSIWARSCRCFTRISKRPGLNRLFFGPDIYVFHRFVRFTIFYVRYCKISMMFVVGWWLSVSPEDKYYYYYHQVSDKASSIDSRVADLSEILYDISLVRRRGMDHPMDMNASTLSASSDYDNSAHRWVVSTTDFITLTPPPFADPIVSTRTFRHTVRLHPQATPIWDYTNHRRRRPLPRREAPPLIWIPLMITSFPRHSMMRPMWWEEGLLMDRWGEGENEDRKTP